MTCKRTIPPTIKFILTPGHSFSTQPNMAMSGSVLTLRRESGGISEVIFWGKSDKAIKRQEYLVELNHMGLQLGLYDGKSVRITGNVSHEMLDDGTAYLQLTVTSIQPPVNQFM